MNMDLGTWSARVASVVREAMVARQFGEESLAELLDTPRSTLASRLDGRTPWDLVEVERLAGWLGVSPSELVGRAHRSTPPPQEEGPPCTATAPRREPSRSPRSS